MLLFLPSSSLIIVSSGAKEAWRRAQLMRALVALVVRQMAAQFLAHRSEAVNIILTSALL